MSFLSELKKQKDKLKETVTVVTTVDGQRFVESNCESLQKLSPSAYGFVVDTKPDIVPALVRDYLYIGSQDCTVNTILSEYDLRNVLSLGIDVQVEVNHKYIDCLDLPNTDLKNILKEALPFIHKAIQQKENILVHCNAGVSRTSTIAIAYLMHYDMMQYDAAYSLVKNIRPVIRPNDGFQAQIKKMNPGCII